MNLPCSIKSDFLNIFYPTIIENISINNNNSKLVLHILGIENNKFNYDALYEALGNSMIFFALSRKTVLEYESKKEYFTLKKLASEKFRNYYNNNGEAGELLLYCFLEAHLMAPKILTKLEIKTAPNNYVNGADAVHLHKIGDKVYNIIYGESKLYKKLTDALTNAFESINNFKEKNITHEFNLVSSQLRNEAIDDDTYEEIKSIIFPNKNNENSIRKNNAFAIFAGFEVTISEDDEKLNNIEFEDKIREDINKHVVNIIDHIKCKIKEYKLSSYCFHIYLLPFTDIDNTRKKIIEYIK